MARFRRPADRLNLEMDSSDAFDGMCGEAPEIEAAAALLLCNRRCGRIFTSSPAPAPASAPALEVYAYQRMLTPSRITAGGRLVGWKVGYTARDQMRMPGPDHAPLTDAMLLPNGADIGKRAQLPRVAPALAIRLGRDLYGRPDLRAALNAVDSARVCLEVMDAADGSAAFVVLGDELGCVGAAERIVVRLERNGEPVAEPWQSVMTAHPLAGVAGLSAQIAAMGVVLRAGDVVVTGGLTGAVDLDPGDTVTAAIDGNIVVSVHRS